MVDRTGVIEELLWFVRGQTDALILREKRVRIWEGNASRAYLDSVNLHDNREGDLGPVYGFQWRHFGAPYTTCEADYTGKGFDQLAEVIDRIKHKPHDRRIILSAWNPADIPKMALPPCHMFCQFYVNGDELSCQMYQRSCDMGLGVPFNIASYALLTKMIAHECGLQPADLVITMGDAHVYCNHVDALKIQLERQPYAFPTMRIVRSPAGIVNYEAADFVLQDYESWPKLDMDMSI